MTPAQVKGRLPAVTARIRALRDAIDAAAAELARRNGEPPPLPMNRPDPAAPKFRSRDLPSEVAPAMLAAMLVTEDRFTAQLAALHAQLDAPAIHTVVRWRDGVTTLERLGPPPARSADSAFIAAA